MYKSSLSDNTKSFSELYAKGENPLLKILTAERFKTALQQKTQMISMAFLPTFIMSFCLQNMEKQTNM